MFDTVVVEVAAEAVDEMGDFLAAGSRQCGRTRATLPIGTARTCRALAHRP
jgi:hypothetical protein